MTRRAAAVPALAFLILIAACVPALAAKKKAAPRAKPTSVESMLLIDTNQPLRTQCYSLRAGGHHGRCEPQGLIYARCRSGNMSCRGNYELSPIGWYQCADKNGLTSQTPAGHAVMILGDNSHHKMKTGHVFYVERVAHKGGDKWELVLSHTNYDRLCHLETEAVGDYDARTKNLAMRSGQWKQWGKDLRALGFIVK